MDESRLRGVLRNNIDTIEERIRAACARAGRSRSDVTLVAVTKSAPDEAVCLLPELGLNHLGENRPQQLWRKAALLPSTVHWHLIGHLQRNKIEQTLPLVELIHSGDRLSLLDSLEVAAQKQGQRIDVLVEVNTSGEASKNGFAPAEVPGLSDVFNSLLFVRLGGLMTMAALVEDAEKCRPSFALLRDLRDRLTRTLTDQHVLHHLSMGMSNDFEVAIEEGATLVRIGTALFAGLAE
ncbi:MAG: YggS family pyridoxal phosphate-dependent enzyme [Planctomycetes bacterium]|nr:YggS family pyridoxal phosphate-dependent enzyme [Planctomycetota bacterium]